MRGTADSSTIYPYTVKTVPENKPIREGGYQVFHVAKQEFVPGHFYKTEAEAIGAAHGLKKGGV